MLEIIKSFMEIIDWMIKLETTAMAENSELIAVGNPMA